VEVQLGFFGPRDSVFFPLLLWKSKPHVSPNRCWILFLLHEPTVVGSKARAKIRTVRGKDGSGLPGSSTVAMDSHKKMEVFHGF